MRSTSSTTCLDLLHRAYKAQDGVIAPASSVTRLTLEQIRRDASDGDLLIAEDDEGTVIGCLFTRAETDAAGDYLYLFHLAVCPLRQGHGAGRALISTAETLARQREIPRLHLMARVELTDNHALFESLGFREAGFFAHEGYHRPTSVRFDKRLTDDPSG